MTLFGVMKINYENKMLKQRIRELEALRKTDQDMIEAQCREIDVLKTKIALAKNEEVNND